MMVICGEWELDDIMRLVVCIPDSGRLRMFTAGIAIWSALEGFIKRKYLH